MVQISSNLPANHMPGREAIFATGALTALNASLECIAEGSATVALAVTGTYVGTITLEGTMDGTNWDPIPVKPRAAAPIYVLTLASAATGRWVGSAGGFHRIRARMSSFTSGSATVSLLADNSQNVQEIFKKPADQSVTATGAAGAAVTLTLPAPGAGLYQHISRLLVSRFASALLTAAAAPVTVTSTNLPGSRAIDFPADAAAQGTIYSEIVEGMVPLRASAANTAVTIVCPATTGVIWRVTADYYNAP